MFEHCWEITLRGVDATPPAAGLPRLDHLAPCASLRERAPARCAAGDERRPRAARGGRTRLRSSISSPCSPRSRRASRSRGTTSTSRGRPSRRSGTTSAAACLPRGMRRRRGEGARDRPRSCLSSLTAATSLDLSRADRSRLRRARRPRCGRRARRVGARRHEPAPRGGRGRDQARGRRSDPLPPDAGREGRRRLRRAQAAHDGGGRRGPGRRLRRRSRRRAHHPRRPDPPPDVDRRAAPALERRPRRHVGDRPEADAPLPGRPLHRASAQAARRSPGPHRVGADPRPRDASVGRPDRARRVVRRASLRARRPGDPPPHAARAVRRHLQGLDGAAGASRRSSASDTTLAPCALRVRAETLRVWRRLA